MTDPLNAPDGTPIVLLPTDHILRSLHHSGGYHSQAEIDEELFGRGPGDVDHWGNPDEPEDLSPSKPLPMLDFMKEIEVD